MKLDCFKKKRFAKLLHLSTNKNTYRENLSWDALLLNIIMNNSEEMIYFKDKDSKYILNSRSNAVLFGFDNPKDLTGKSDFDFFPEDFAMEALEDEQRIMKTKKSILGKIEKWVKSDGETVWFYTSKYPFYDGKGAIIGVWGTSRDITSLKLVQDELAKLNKKLEKANLELQKKSNVDGLSELYNQRRFYEVLEDTINIYSKEQMRADGVTVMTSGEANLSDEGEKNMDDFMDKAQRKGKAIMRSAQVQLNGMNNYYIDLFYYKKNYYIFESTAIRTS